MWNEDGKICGSFGQVPTEAHVPEAQGRVFQAERGRDKGPGARNRKAAAVEDRGAKGAREEGLERMSVTPLGQRLCKLVLTGSNSLRCRMTAVVLCRFCAEQEERVPEPKATVT